MLEEEDHQAEVKHLAVVIMVKVNVQEAVLKEDSKAVKCRHTEGFQIINKLNYAEINVGRIEQLGLKEVSLETLKEAKRVHPSADGLRVLGNGEIKKAVTIKASYVTPSAKEKIEAAGGKVELV